jgi:hypothetical protein
VMGGTALMLSLACTNHLAVDASTPLWLTDAGLQAPPRVVWQPQNGGRAVRAALGPSLAVLRRQSFALDHFTLKAPMSDLGVSPIAPSLLIGRTQSSEVESAEAAGGWEDTADDDKVAKVRADVAAALNASQRAAFDAATASLFGGPPCSGRLTLIQGPPGTGKTHTCVAILRVWLEAQREQREMASAMARAGRSDADADADAIGDSAISNRASPVQDGEAPDTGCGILVTGFSNIAIDNIASGLMRLGWNVLRAGRGATALTSITISERIKGDARYGEVLSARHNRNFNSAREMEMKISLDLVRKADVVLATCITYVSRHSPAT